MKHNVAQPKAMLKHWLVLNGLDVLPVQASAVPCEHVFSSGKETDAARWSNLSPDMMERLQILKYLFREERLSFENDWMDTEQDMLAAESRIVTINENQ